MIYPKIEELEEKNILEKRFLQLDNKLQLAYNNANSTKNPELKTILENCISLFDIVKMKNDRILFEAERLEKYLDSFK